MTDAPQVFNAHAADYDAGRRRLIPPFESFYGAAVDGVRLGGAAPRRIVDLGAGTGLLSGFLRAAFPDAQLTLVDGAGRMLERARTVLGTEDVSYIEADLTDRLPEGPWDAIVSGLAVHHLSDGEKRSLMQRIHAALRPGGVFVNAEQVAGPSPFFTDLYATWHEAQARRAGSDDEEWTAAVGRMAYDRCASVEDQLEWLRQAGFREADCLFKEYRFAVMVALR
jgi:tRNA (cmo5U34)-methyltransferase